MYTSGSTGKPKGVVIPHRAVSRLVVNNGYAALEASDRVAFAANPAFDASTLEVWGPLLNGGSVVVVPQEALLAPAALAETLSTHRVTVLWMTVGLFNQVHGALAGVIPQLRYLIVGGDALDVEVMRRVVGGYRPQHLLNGYGPTETTTFALTHEIEEIEAGARSVPLGRPIGNTRVYVLDEMGRPAPVDVAGELYIGGDGVGLGYVNDAEQTSERFVADPFSDGPGARLYRTGDLGRWRGDGRVEFLGRNDFQVKVRGFRIELGEIETRLGSAVGVGQVVVTARQEGAGDKRLVAYYVGAAEVESLRAHAQAGLPEYMVPAAYVKLEALPLTANGKVDRRALPAPEAGAFGSGAYEAPVGPVEETLAEIWGEVLRVERVGRQDNFFALGGHSLLAVTVVDRMSRSGLRADVRALFSAANLADLAGLVAQSDAPAALDVPPNRIPAGAEAITPEMLPLVTLEQRAIDGIVARVPGGAPNVQDIYPLAPLQEGILFHHLLEREGDPYLLPILLSFRSRERLDRFAATVQVVIDRHDILRTAVFWTGLDEPVQVVLRAAPFRVEAAAACDPASGDVAEQLKATYDPRHFRIDVSQAPLLRGFVAEDPANERWLLLVLAHHLAIDHTTMDLLVAETELIDAGRLDQLAPVVPFRTFVAHARLGKSPDQHEAYFRGRLGDLDEPTVPFGLLDVRGEVPTIQEARRALDLELSAAMRAQSRRLGVSTASLVHLAWALVVARASDRQDVAFGTVLLGRMLGGANAHQVLGLFINTLPIRITVGTGPTRAALLAVQADLAALIEHEHASLVQAQRASGLAPGVPLFSALLNYRHSGTPSADSAGDRVDAAAATGDGADDDGVDVIWGEERSNYPLTLSVDDLGRGFLLTAQVSAPVDPARVCAMMETALRGLVQVLESAPETPVDAIDVLPAAERRQVLEEWNGTVRAYPRDTALGALFDQQAARAPDALAVVDGPVELSYAALAARADALARALLAAGVQLGDRVAVSLDRSATLIVAELGVVKAGAAYVPLDNVLPGIRQSLMVRDCGARVIVTARDRVLPDELSALIASGELRRLDPDDPALAGPAGPAPATAAEGGSAAYVMYTSGSTGTPKGVVIPHRAVSRLVLNNGYARFEPGDRVAFAANPAFDASTLEVWAPLLNGGCVVVVSQEILLSPPSLAEALSAQRVNVLWMTVGFFNQVHAALSGVIPSLRYLIVGGDALDVEVMRRVSEEFRPQHLLNGYGPTETTTFALTHEIDEVPATMRAVPLGRPIGNTQVYVLDRQLRPAPVHAAGELYIGGDGLGVEYLNDPALTAERFVADPFTREAGGRLYKTGDLGRWRGDGTIEFLGRNDSQVKVRGFRIELGEIESRLAEAAGVEQVVVVAQEHQSGDKRLVAYYTGAQALDPDGLRAHARQTLPEYMVPVAYVRLSELPLTRNGKVDRRALPAVAGDRLPSRAYEAPHGEPETTLAQIWADVLGVPRVGRGDNFFALGGHSLLAVTLVERMRNAGLHADVRTVFASATLAELAAEVAGAGASAWETPANLIPPDAPAITPEMLTLVSLDQAAIDRIVARVPGGAPNVQDVYPLAPLQEGILFHHLMDRQGDAYVLPVLLAFPSREALDRFTGALQRVIDRHDILRTAIAYEGLVEPVQVVHRRAVFPVEMVQLDASGGAAADDQLKALHRSARGQIDIGAAPLLRGFAAHDADGDRWLLLVLAHHLAIDHTTLDLLVAETDLIQRGEVHRLTPPAPFRDFVAQARLGVSREEHQAFFRAMLADIDEPTAPFGLLDVRGDAGAVAETQRFVEPTLTARLRAQARIHGVSTASLLHLAFSLVLSRASGRRDVVFGTVLLGRMQAGSTASRVLGLFINTLPIRVPVGETAVAPAVADMHKRLSELIQHEHASLAAAQRCSGVPAPAPLFSALLNYRHSPQPEGAAPGSGQAQPPRPGDGTPTGEGEWGGTPEPEVEPIWGEERTNYPLTLSVDDYGDDLKLTVQVVAPVAPDRVCGMMERALTGLVEALESSPETAVGAIDVLPAEERQQLLETWNGTAAAYPDGDCIHDLIAKQAQQTPGAVALEFEGRAVTYQELEMRSRRLAHRLRELGVGPGTRVAVCAERSPEMVVGLVAAMKAGGAYVPLDPTYPTQRLAELLADCVPVAVLTHGPAAPAVAAALTELSGSLPVMDLDADLTDGQERAADLDAGVTSRDLAYVIYTSGSTGKPKGAMNEHRAVVNRLVWLQRHWRLGPGDVFLQKTPFTFDVSVGEIFGPLISGSRLVIARPEGHKDPAYLADVIAARGVNVVHFVPSMLQLFLEHEGVAERCRGVRRVMCSGEALPAPVVERFHERFAGVELLNLYGPTEAAVEVLTWLCAPEDAAGPIPIGRPIANARAYVLDEARRPAPVGVPGELYIGGVPVGRGYLNRPDLTAERFVADPFAGEVGARMYKTGDVARWRPDGAVEYLGRNDFQVKVRGFRIELGEIEARMLELDGVKEAVVVAREDRPGDQRLVAYYTAAEAQPLETLRGALRARVPEHMVPTTFVHLDALPLNASGKIDRKALPLVDSAVGAATVYQEPDGEIEIALADIWCRVLGVARVGRQDDFFALGGHSLLAVQALTRIRTELLVDLQLSELFLHPRLEALADRIVEAQLAQFDPDALAALELNG
ncbi:MAG TPA: amino acid adenylation domain-containing protein [Polyangia bacterium]|nr:amino acid adenylation domain-containing protein [Polyangia bacterium]